MTCKEKLMKDHPELIEENGIDSIVEHDCPHQYMDLMAPDYCQDDSPDECARCWEREFYEDFEDAINKVCAVGNPNPIPPEQLKKALGILDSGDRTQFSSGAVRDMHAGKGRMDLLPWAAVMEVSKHCENGAIKYGEHNVDRGIPTSSLCDSAARHLAKYLDGWTDEPHLVAAAWNLLWAIQMEVKNKDMVNTPWKKEET